MINTVITSALLVACIAVTYQVTPTNCPYVEGFENSGTYVFDIEPDCSYVYEFDCRTAQYVVFKVTQRSNVGSFSFSDVKSQYGMDGVFTDSTSWDAYPYIIGDWNSNVSLSISSGTSSGSLTLAYSLRTSSYVNDLLDTFASTTLTTKDKLTLAAVIVFIVISVCLAIYRKAKKGKGVIGKVFKKVGGQTTESTPKYGPGSTAIHLQEVSVNPAAGATPGTMPGMVPGQQAYGMPQMPVPPGQGVAPPITSHQPQYTAPTIPGNPHGQPQAMTPVMPSMPGY